MRFSVLCTFLIVIGSGFGQTVSKDAFDLASIRPSSPLPADLAGGLAQVSRSGAKITATQASFTRVSLKDLIARAYRVEPFRVSGPGWMDTAQFDVVAKIPTGGAVAAVPEMLQKLLIDRFTLKAHLTTKEYQVYVLSLADGGIAVAPQPEGYVAGSGGSTMPVSMDQLVFRLSRTLEGSVVNQTGLDGTYMFPRDFVVALANRLLWQRTGKPPALEQAMAIPSEGDIVKAVNAAGFRIEARKLALSMVIIDGIEKMPTEN